MSSMIDGVHASLWVTYVRADRCGIDMSGRGRFSDITLCPTISYPWIFFVHSLVEDLLPVHCLLFHRPDIFFSCLFVLLFSVSCYEP